MAHEVQSSGTVAMDLEGRIQLPKGAAITAAILRIGIGLIYLWGFVSQAFGVTYSNGAVDSGEPDYGWHISYDADAGWVASGFSSSPTEGYVSSLHGPTAFIPQAFPTGVDDFVWM